MADTLTLAPTSDPKKFRAPDGRLLTPPADWTCLPPGDAGLTRRVKLAGPSWQVVEKRGRKTFSQGLWAPALTVDRIKAELAAERATPAYAKKLAAGRQRRDREQTAYVEEFDGQVVAFLAFAPHYADLARRMARRVTEHATPVGSGTVARTERIPVAERAEAAVIAWMRHQTTAYDNMSIPRIKGKRREVRRQLAAVSRVILDRHRGGSPHAPEGCPLCHAMAHAPRPGNADALLDDGDGDEDVVEMFG